MNKQTCFILLANPNICQNITKNDITYKIGEDFFLTHQIKNILKFHKRSKVIVISDVKSIAEVREEIKTNRVSYLEQSHDDMSNVGSYLNSAIEQFPNSHIAIMNLCMFFNPNLMSNLKLMDTAIMISKHKKFESKIGCTIDRNKKVNFVFYDLENKVCEFLYIHKKDIHVFKHIIKEHSKKGMYLFEIINTLIQHGVDIQSYDINEDILHLYDSNQLKKIKRLIKKYETYSL